MTWCFIAFEFVKLNKLVKNYNFTKDTNGYSMKSITNDKYLINIDYYTHPQFDEVELSVEILYTNTNNKLYKKKYILLENIDRTRIILEEPIENFMNNFGLKKITEGHGSYLKGDSNNNISIDNLNILFNKCLI